MEARPYLGGDAGRLGDLLELVKVLGLGVEVDAALDRAQGSCGRTPLGLGGLVRLDASLQAAQAELCRKSHRSQALQD